MGMKKFKYVCVLLGLIGSLGALAWVISSEQTVVMHPKGLVAQQEWSLIKINLLLMQLIMVPTWVWLFWTAWRYRAGNREASYDANYQPSRLQQTMQWGLPTVVIAIMAIVNWPAIRALDPYRPIENGKEPIEIQVVALNWKWLFIYPKEQIATLNFIQIPVHTPIKFSLTADDSPMNSFWVPQLSGQIYAMTGMVTPLHIVADEIGLYRGKAAEINGKGYAAMNFVVKATTDADFQSWVSEVQQSSNDLTDNAYEELILPSTHEPVRLYAHVAEDLFDRIVMKPMHPQ
jgi:cytochrome o ubiquinol oxidase subunit 2